MTGNEVTHEEIALLALSLFVKRIEAIDGNYFELYDDEQRYQLSLQDWYAAESQLSNEDTGEAMSDQPQTVQPPNEPEPQPEPVDQPETVQPASEPEPQTDARPDDSQTVPTPATVVVQE